MTQLKSAAIVTQLADELIEHGSWCGATHLQKATYFLKVLAEVPLDYEFVLYWHGPYSFDLRDHITAMTADGLIEVRPQPAPYGPKLRPSETAHKLWEKFPKTLNRVSPSIRFVSEHIGEKGAPRLERLSTALYVMSDSSALTPSLLATKVRELKPHVSEQDALRAVEEVLAWREEWASIGDGE